MKRPSSTFHEQPLDLSIIKWLLVISAIKLLKITKKMEEKQLDKLAEKSTSVKKVEK